MVHGCNIDFAKITLVFIFNLGAYLNVMMSCSSDSLFPELKLQPMNKTKPVANYLSKSSQVYKVQPSRETFDEEPNSSSSKNSSEMKVVGLKTDKLGMGRLRAVKFQSNQSQGGVLRHLWSSLHSMDRNSFTKLNNLRRKRFAFGGEHLNATSDFGEEKWDKDALAIFHELVTHCLPASQKTARHGYFRILQKNTFQVECDHHKVRPLNTYHNWSCDPKWLLKGYSFVPTMCNDQVLPTVIYMEQDIQVTGLVDSKCGHTADLGLIQDMWISQLKRRATATFRVDGFLFKFRLALAGGECIGGFLRANNFQVQTNVLIRVMHNPVTFSLGETTHAEVQRILDTEVNIMFNTLLQHHKIKNFTVTGEHKLFQAMECPDNASTVQEDEISFTSKIPSCRYCDRGLYLNEFGACTRCSGGWYAGPKSSACLRCPLVQDEKSVSGDSLTDCFSVSICEDCVIMAFTESMMVVASFHFSIILLILWKFRSVLWTKDVTADKDEDLTATSNRNSISK